jgi:hypothetical protein
MMSDTLTESGLVRINPSELVIEPVGGPAALLAFARDLVIKDALDYEMAGHIFVKIKEKRKTIETRCRPNIKRWDEGHKSALAELKQEDAPFVQAEGLIGPKLTVWDQEQERLRLAKEKEEQEAERKRAEEEQLQEALTAEACGDTVAAEEIISAPVTVQPTVLPKVAKPPGMTYQNYYSAEVVNLMVLVKAVVAGKVPINAIQANQSMLNTQADKLQGQFEQYYPGCALKVERKPKSTGKRA